MDAGPGGADEAVHARPALRAHPAVAKGKGPKAFAEKRQPEWKVR